MRKEQVRSAIVAGWSVYFFEKERGESREGSWPVGAERGLPDDGKRFEERGPFYLIGAEPSPKGGCRGERRDVAL